MNRIILVFSLALCSACATGEMVPSTAATPAPMSAPPVIPKMAETMDAAFPLTCSGAVTGHDPNTVHNLEDPPL